MFALKGVCKSLMEVIYSVLKKRCDQLPRDFLSFLRALKLDLWFPLFLLGFFLLLKINFQSVNYTVVRTWTYYLRSFKIEHRNHPSSYTKQVSNNARYLPGVQLMFQFPCVCVCAVHVFMPELWIGFIESGCGYESGSRVLMTKKQSKICPSYRRSLQPSKENIQQFKKLNL